MRAEFWAILTAVSWAVGSFFEKKGVKLGGFAPVMGTAIRTSVSLLVLAALSYPYWSQLRAAGAKPILMIAIGGGVCAGGLGLLFFYLKRKELPLESGDTWSGVWASMIKAGLARLGMHKTPERNWRPNIIMFGGDKLQRSQLAEFGSAMAARMLMMATTIKSSIKVKPVETRRNLIFSPFRNTA